MSRQFTVVCVSGYCGHIEYLKNAKLLGDKLIVILNRNLQRIHKNYNISGSTIFDP
jgi:bifunctional ADP-heptose synthase (sugar kinase/adenylyltransferase)